MRKFQGILIGVTASATLVFGVWLRSALDSPGPPPRLLLSYCFLPPQAAAAQPATDACRFEGPTPSTAPLNEVLPVRIFLGSTLSFPVSGCTLKWYLHEGWTLMEDPAKRTGELAIPKLTPEGSWEADLRIVPLRKGTSSPLTIDMKASYGTCRRLKPLQMPQPVSGPNVVVL